MGKYRVKRPIEHQKITIGPAALVSVSDIYRNDRQPIGVVISTYLSIYAIGREYTSRTARYIREKYEVR